MEFERLVQVRLSIPGAQKSEFGSGYLVAPRLVLTAAHVLGDKRGPKPGTVTVCRPAPYTADTAGGQETAAPGLGTPTVRWYRKDDAVDAVLVEIHDAPAEDGARWPVPESLQDTATRPPQRWGRLIGQRPHPVTLVGYPLMQYDPTTLHSYDKQLDEHISPGSGSLARRYEISSTDPVLIPLVQQNTATIGWSGHVRRRSPDRPALGRPAVRGHRLRPAGRRRNHPHRHPHRHPAGRPCLHRRRGRTHP